MHVLVVSWCFYAQNKLSDIKIMLRIQIQIRIGITIILNMIIQVEFASSFPIFFTTDDLDSNKM